MPRYESGSHSSSPNVISIRLDSGGSLNFRRRGDDVHVFLLTSDDQTLVLATLTVDRLCALGNALTALCTHSGVPDDEPPVPEGERFSLLEVD